VERGLIDAYAWLLVRSVAAATFALITFISAGFLAKSGRNGVTSLFTLLMLSTSYLAACIFYTGFSNVTGRTLPQSVLDFNYYNYVRESIGWILCSGWSLALGWRLSKGRSKSPEQIAQDLQISEYLIRKILKEAGY
jgi:hypothetical protein